MAGKLVAVLSPSPNVELFYFPALKIRENISRLFKKASVRNLFWPQQDWNAKVLKGHIASAKTGTNAGRFTQPDQIKTRGHSFGGCVPPVLPLGYDSPIDAIGYFYWRKHNVLQYDVSSIAESESLVGLYQNPCLNT